MPSDSTKPHAPTCNTPPSRQLHPKLRMCCACVRACVLRACACICACTCARGGACSKWKRGGRRYVFSYRMCSLVECVLLWNVFSDRTCSRIDCVLLQNVFSYRTCSLIECVLLQPYTPVANLPQVDYAQRLAVRQRRYLSHLT